MFSALELQAMLSDPWSNNACLGYTIKALEELNYTPEDVEKIVQGMKDGFECTSVEEADKRYRYSEY